MKDIAANPPIQQKGDAIRLGTADDCTGRQIHGIFENSGEWRRPGGENV